MNARVVVMHQMVTDIERRKIKEARKKRIRVTYRVERRFWYARDMLHKHSRADGPGVCKPLRQYP